MLESRRVAPHFWKLNRRYAARIDAILDGLDSAFTAAGAGILEEADDVVELDEEA